MRHPFFAGLSAVLATLVLASVAAACSEAPAACGEQCSEYGTTVDFLSTPAEAARQAQKEEKLVLVLHVSGHFEESTYT